MAGVNKVILVGRLGKDPEVRYAQQNNLAVAKFTLATDSGFGDKRKTEWHNITVFGKPAENCKNFLHKGSLVASEGRITYDKWQKDENTSVNITTIIAEKVSFLDSRNADNAGGGFNNGGNYGGGGYNNYQGGGNNFGGGNNYGGNNYGGNNYGGNNYGGNNFGDNGNFGNQSPDFGSPSSNPEPSDGFDDEHVPF